MHAQHIQNCKVFRQQENTHLMDINIQLNDWVLTSLAKNVPAIQSTYNLQTKDQQAITNFPHIKIIFHIHIKSINSWEGEQECKTSYRPGNLHGNMVYFKYA